jgi:uncharacterized protein (TIGR02246 family)
MRRAAADTATRVALALCLSLAAPMIATTQEQGSDERAVRAVEQQVEAASARNDADTLSTLWAPDYLFVNPDGQRLTGAQRLDMFSAGNMRYDRYSVDQETVRLYGSTALVFYRSTVAGGGGADLSSVRRVTDVLVKRDGRWQVVSQQSSRIVNPAVATPVGAAPALQIPDPLSASESPEPQILRTEKDIADALETNDADALEQLWAPEFVWVGPAGQVMTRAERLRDIRTGSMSPGRYAIGQELIRVYGSTAVVLFRSTQAGTLNGKDISSQRQVTNVLVRSGGRWRAVAQHSTLVAP